MGVKLMTGATGEQNIQAADDRECLAGITGLDSYVFPTGNRLKATLVDANTVAIGTGAGSIQGSRFRCSTTTTVTIQSGTQGQFRHDIVGLRFSRETSGREGLEFQVLTGKPASSEGAVSDPSYTKGDLLKGDAEAFMPLYRVKLSGINASDPEPMFSILAPLATLQDSMPQDSGWTYLNGSASTENYVAYRTIGQVVFWRVRINGVPVGSTGLKVGTIPAALCPSITGFYLPLCTTFDLNDVAKLYIGAPTSPEVWIYTYGGNGIAVGASSYLLRQN